MEVPVLDLKQQFASIRDEIMSAVRTALERQDCCNGAEVRELEKLVAEYCHCAYGIGVTSGTDALLCSTMALEIGHGDEVITTPFTFFASAACIWRVGAKPVFVDIDPDTFTIDPAKIEAAVTDRTRAILPVHLFGQMAEMSPILRIAEKHGLSVIEDAAQAIGATQDGCKACSFGTVGCLSFYPAKNLGAIGDGGMIVTRDPELSEKLAAFHCHGESTRYHHQWVGGNFRMATIQAAALLVKLRLLDGWVAQRRRCAARYQQMLGDFQPVTLPIIREGNESVFNYYVIRTPRRDELKDFLQTQGISTAVYYPRCLHEQECFASLGYKRGDFPQAERAANEVLALPIFPELLDEQIDYVAAKIMEFLAPADDA